MKPIISSVSLILFLSLCFSSSSPVHSANSTECPMDLSYALTIPWNVTQCKDYHHPNTSPNATTTPCCQALLSLFGIALAQHLRDTHLFQLPDLPTSVSCLRDFQAKLSSLSLQSDLTTLCFDPTQFVITPHLCASIETTQDWIERLGPSTELDTSCRSDLTDPSSCNACVASGFRVQADLIAVDGNKSHSGDCFYFAVLYAAGIVHQSGPKSVDSISCILGLPLPARRKTHRALIFGLVAAGLASLLICGFLGFYCLWYKRRRHKKRSEGVGETRPSPRRKPASTLSIWFKIQELEKATDNFSDRNFIGRGGFGMVYKGVLSDGAVVAVKKIIESDNNQGNDEFRNEVEIISNLKHRNIVPLRGCCLNEDGAAESEKYLVYDYMSNGNLDDHLFDAGRSSPLTWQQRRAIILDLANALAYLHYGVKPAIFHRDIKGTNILLDSDMRARVADFGLAKESKEGQSLLTTRVAGTHGYLAPEYALYGQLTERSDVYSFGVVVLEVMCGRRALELGTDSGPTPLITDWAWSLVKSGEIERALDPSLLACCGDDGLNKGVMERFVRVGILCAHVMVALRPTILEALRMLEGDAEVPAIPDRPTPLGHPSFFRVDDENNFSISPALSALQLQSGDMLR